KIYNTDYVAGFEKIESARYTSETAGRRSYKPFISDETMARLFGTNWPNLKKYFNTELQETRTRYRQDPKIWKVPLQRINFRFKGPNERYKLQVGFRELQKGRDISSLVEDGVKAEITRSYSVAKSLSVRARSLYTPSERDLLHLEQTALQIAGADFYGIISKTETERRILSFDPASNVYMV